MLYIQNYDKALEFHKELLSCWLKIKIYGVSRTKKGCNYCGKIKCKNIATQKHNEKFSDSIKRFFTFQIIEDLIAGKPKEILKISKQYSQSTFENSDKENIEKLFKNSGYKNFYQDNFSKDFLNLLGRSTCTYCNRNYTLNISSRHASAQLDHWFPKSMFPILSLSFFNLIPSCGSCNHIKGKSDKDEEWWYSFSIKQLLHPYFPEIDESFKFDFSYEASSKEFTVDFREILGKKMLNTLNFNLTLELYQAQAQLELKDLYDLRKKYSTNYVKFLLEKLHETEPSDQEKYRLLFGVEKNDKDYHKRPFSKFKNDIIEKLLSLQ